MVPVLASITSALGHLVGAYDPGRADMIAEVALDYSSSGRVYGVVGPEQYIKLDTVNMAAQCGAEFLLRFDPGKLVPGESEGRVFIDDCSLTIENHSQGPIVRTEYWLEQHGAEIYEHAKQRIDYEDPVDLGARQVAFGPAILGMLAAVMAINAAPRMTKEARLARDAYYQQ